jgi:hypothetical protein
MIKLARLVPPATMSIEVLTRWRPVLRLVLVLAGIALAFSAQDRLARRDGPYLAVLLFVLAGVCVGSVIPVGEVWNRTLEVTRVRLERWWPVVPLALAVAVIGCLDVVLRKPILAWGYLVALIALSVGCWLADPSGANVWVPYLLDLRADLAQVRERILKWRPSAEVLLVVAMLLLTFFIRVWQWDAVPPGTAPDEPWHVINARGLMEDHPDTTPFESPQWRHPNIHHFLAAALLLPGTDPQLALVLLGAIPGTISVGLLYLVVRQVNGPMVAFTAAALFSLNRWYVLFTRKGDDIGLPLALALAALLFMLLGLRSGRLLWFVLAGIACGVNVLYLYVGSLTVFWIFLAWLLLRRMGTLSTRDSLLGLAVSGLTAICVFLPRGLTIALRPTTFGYSAQHLAPWSGQGNALDVYWHQLRQAVLAFGYQSGGEPWLVFADSGPAMFDVVSAALAMMGVGYFISRIREPWARFWLITGALGILASSASIGPGGYNWRLTMAIPPLMVGAALVLVGTSRFLTVPTTRFARLAWVPIILALFFVGLSTYQDYFVGFRMRESIWISGAAHSLRATRWLRDHSALLPTTMVVTSRDIGTTAAFLLLRPAMLGRTSPHVILDDLENVPLAVQLQPEIERIWIMTAADPWEDSWLALGTRGIGERARRYYPGGEERLERDPYDGRPLFYVYELTREQVEQRHGLRRVPDARCSGSSTIGGWQGMIYITGAGRYRLSGDTPGLCAKLDLLENNSFAEEMYLSRGWHPITLTGTGREMPQLQLLRENGNLPLPRHHMFSGDLEPIGFEAIFAEEPGGSPVSYSYLTVFDRNWEAYPPTEDKTFYLELKGNLDLPQTDTYAFRWQVAGPFEFLIDGEVIARTDSEQVGEVWAMPKQYSAGIHSIEVRYDSRIPITTWGRIYPGGQTAQVLDWHFVSPP